MKEADIAGLIEQFKIIRASAAAFYKVGEKDMDSHFYSELRESYESYNRAIDSFDKLKGDSITRLERVRLERFYTHSYNPENLIRMITECGKALAVLGKLASPTLTPNEIDKLNFLRQELEKISSDINYKTNLEEAIKECEQGHFLASALISSRVIIYSLDKISGKTNEEKLKFLTDKGKIEVGREDLRKQFIKASKETRNFFSHDIKIFATPEEALSLLSDCVRIIKLVS